MEADGFINVTQVMKPAVYALVYQGRVVYVGRTKTPCSRFTSHLYGTTSKAIPGPATFKSRVVSNYKMTFDEIWIRPCAQDELHEVETAMIKKYSPKYNLNHSSFQRTEVDFGQLLDRLISAETKTVASIVRRL